VRTLSILTCYKIAILISQNTLNNIISYSRKSHIILSERCVAIDCQSGRFLVGDFVWATFGGRLLVGDFWWATLYGRLSMSDFLW
jgi:hypothetical protein